MKLQDYFPSLLEKKILLSEIGISPRVYLSWKEEELILSNEEVPTTSDKTQKRKWVCLNAFEALWLLIVVELRKLNLDLKTIKKLKEFLKESPDYIKAFESINEDDFQNKVVSMLTPEMLGSIGGSTSRETLMKLLPNILNSNLNSFTSNLGNILHGVFIAKTSPSLIIRLTKVVDQDCFEFIIAHNNHPEIDRKEELFRFYSETCAKSTFINIPLVSIVEQLFENEKVFNQCFEYGFFNKQEKQLLEAVRNKECEEIKIVKHQSGDYTINFSDVKEIIGEEAKKLRRTLGLKMYERVEVIFRNENHLVIKNTNKTIVKKE